MRSSLTNKILPKLLSPNNALLTERAILKRAFHQHQNRSLSFTTTNNIFSQTTAYEINYYYYHDKSLFTRRQFSKRGRKGAATGHHLDNLREMAHGEERGKKKHDTKEGGVVTEELEDDSDEEEANTLPDSKEVRERMMKVLSHMEESFRRIRGAEPTAELFEVIPVRAYGAYAPLNSVAQVVITSPQLVTIACFDPSIAPSVCDAVRDAGYNFNPRSDDAEGNVIIPIPRVSQETRASIVKALRQKAERCRVLIRNVRKKYLNVVNLGKQGKLEGISKDEGFRCLKELDDVTNEVIQSLNESIAEKENKIMNV